MRLIPDKQLDSKIVKRVAQPAQNGISGAGNFADGDHFTITNGAGISEVYECDAGGGITPGEILVDLTAVPPGFATAAAVAGAILANSALVTVTYIQTGASSVIICLAAKVAGVAGNAYTLALTNAGTSRYAATFYDGSNAVVKQTVSVLHTMLAVEADEGYYVIGLPFSSTRLRTAMRTALGAAILDYAVDTTVPYSIVIIEGATAWAVGDTFLLEAED